MERRVVPGLFFLLFSLEVCWRNCFAADETGVGVHLTQQPSSVIVLPGTRVVFNCQTNCFIDKFSWQFNWRDIPGADVAGRDLNSGHLVVQVAHDPETYSKQVGEYRCVAWIKPLAVTSLPATLTVARILPFSDRPNSALKVLEGGSVSIACPPPVSDPPADIVFLKDGQPLWSSGDSVLLLPGGHLHLSDVTPTSSGRYSCRATNTLLNRTISAPFYTDLRVVEQREDEPSSLPVLLEAPRETYPVLAGSNLRIECVVSGWPIPVVRWRRSSNSQWSHRYIQHAASLEIRDVQRSDQDTFFCQASNAFGTITAMTRIKILEPPMVTTPAIDMLVTEGDRVVIDCIVSGFPEPTIQWTFKGRLLYSKASALKNPSAVHENPSTSHNNASIDLNEANAVLSEERRREEDVREGESVSPDVILMMGARRLSIKSVSLEHAGYYQCFGHNKLGDNSTGVALRVKPLTVISLESEDGDTDPPSEKKRKYSAHQSVSDADRRPRHERLQLPVPSTPKLHQLSDVSVMVTWDLINPGHDTKLRSSVSLPAAGNVDNADNSYDYDEDTAKDPYEVQFFKIQFRQVPSRSFRNVHWHTIEENIGKNRRSFLVAGLRLRSRYKFRVFTVYNNNDNRHGPNSVRIKLRRIRPRERIQLPPKLLPAQPISARDIRLQWEYDTSAAIESVAEIGTNRIWISGYFIHYQNALSADDYNVVRVEYGDVENYTVTNLLPAVDYEFKLQALSSRGGGSPLSNAVRTRTLDLVNLLDVSAGVSRITASSGPASQTTIAPVIVRTREMSASRARLYKTIGGLLASLAVCACLFVLVVLHCRGRHKMFADAADLKQSESGQHIRLQSAPFINTNLASDEQLLQQQRTAGQTSCETESVAMTTQNVSAGGSSQRHAAFKTCDTQQGIVSKPVAIPTPPVYPLQADTLPSIASLRQNPASTDTPSSDKTFIRSSLADSDVYKSTALNHNRLDDCFNRLRPNEVAPSSGDFYHKRPSVTDGVSSALSSESSLNSRPTVLDANGNRRKRLHRRDSMEAQRNRMKTRLRSWQ